MNTQNSPFACDLSVLSDQERRTHTRVSKDIFTKIQGADKLPDGYAFRLPSNGDTLRALADFITRERRCCPFYDFTIQVKRQGGPIWLQLSGREGVKQFIREEMSQLPQLQSFF